MLWGEGKGFEISQLRLDRAVFTTACVQLVQPKKLELMVKRGITREAFGKRIANLGKNPEVIAKARIEIESMRRMVLTAAKAMDELGNAEARAWVSAVKAMVPIRTCQIVDEAIQIHGGTACRSDSLARMYASQRTLRLADGPDEVHWFVVGRSEIASTEEAARNYNPKETFYAEKGSDSAVAFSDPDPEVANQLICPLSNAANRGDWQWTIYVGEQFLDSWSGRFFDDVGIDKVGIDFEQEQF